MPNLNVRRILVPIDFSACSRAALEYAESLAERFGATIDLIYVWEVPPYIPPESMVGVPGHDTQTLVQVAHQNAEQEMQRFTKDLKERGVKIGRALLDSGDPGRTIVEVAEDEGYDLIVAGTHGRTGFSHLIMGSVAERIVRHAKCPVLTVRVPDKPAPSSR